MTVARALGQGLIDWRSLEQLSDGDRQFERELLAMFIEDSQPRLFELGEAVAEQDAPRTAKLAHYLKGASGNVGIMPLYACAATLETQARGGELRTGQALLTEMIGLFEQVKGVLSQL